MARIILNIFLLMTSLSFVLIGVDRVLNKKHKGKLDILLWFGAGLLFLGAYEINTINSRNIEYKIHEEYSVVGFVDKNTIKAKNRNGDIIYKNLDEPLGYHLEKKIDNTPEKVKLVKYRKVNSKTKEFTDNILFYRDLTGWEIEEMF